MALSPLDRDRLQEALALAEQSIGLSDPNPRVGCVIGREDGTVLGRGFTQEAGGPHAEVMALREARAAGADLRGATAWVTLEPCAHHGRTPPCCDALVDAGLARVVVAVRDPNPLVAGQGLARLRAAGIDTVVGDDDLALASRELNIGFFSRMERGRPWVRLKVAMSLDGRTALLNGKSQWITGPEARTDGHAWRRRAGAVLTGIGTVLADDPRMDVRLVPTARQPLRVVIDSHLRMPADARLLSGPGRTVVCHATPDAGGSWSARAGGHVRPVRLPGPDDRVDLGAVLRELHGLDVNELHVEAGPTLSGAFLAAGLVDELLVYVAPRLLGPGREMAALPPIEELTRSIDLRFVRSDPVGSDLRLLLRRASS